MPLSRRSCGKVRWERDFAAGRRPGIERCNSSAYFAVPYPLFVKGERIEKGRGIPLPFSVFLVPFVTVQKERLFFSKRKRDVLFLLLDSFGKETASCLLTVAGKAMVLLQSLQSVPLAFHFTRRFVQTLKIPPLMRGVSGGRISLLRFLQPRCPGQPLQQPGLQQYLQIYPAQKE